MTDERGTDAPAAAIAVRVAGLGARPVDAGLRVEPGGLVLAFDGRDFEVAHQRIAGLAVVRSPEAVLVLHLVNGAELRVTTAEAAEPFDAVLARLVADAFALPELMRGMRAFGSARALPGMEHDRFFAPLVAPLRALRAAHAESLGAGADAAPWRAADAIGATRAGAELRATLSALAAERFPASAPDRRALEAELLDETEELNDALDALNAAAQRLGVAPVRERVAAWRVWCAALADTLVVADRCWARVVPALRDAPMPRERR